MTRVVVGADTFLEREGIARVLERAGDIEVVAWAASESSVLAAVDRERPDVLMVAVQMAPTYTDEGIRLAARLRSDHPAIGVVALGPRMCARYAVDLFATGASGRAYLLAGRIASGDELISAIRDVAAGATVVDPAVVDTLVAHRQDEDGLLARLTARELDVLALVADGLSNARVAATLGLSKKAVEKHVGEIFSRLGLHDDVEVSRRVTASLVFLREAGRIVGVDSPTWRLPAHGGEASWPRDPV
jgi:DNA-binding NarL/FixJ family response regulator